MVRSNRNVGASLTHRGEIARLRQEKATLEKRLAKAEQVIEVQGKVYALLRAVAGESAEPKDEAPWTKR